MRSRPSAAPSQKSVFVSSAIKTIKIVYSIAPRLVVGRAIGTLLEALSPLAFALIAKQIIDSVLVVRGQQVIAGHFIAPLTWILIQGGMVLLLVIVAEWGSYAIRTLRSRVGMALSQQVLTKANNLAYRHFQDAKVLTQLMRAREQMTERPSIVMNHALGLFQAIVTLVSCAAMIWAFTPWLLLVLLLAALPPFLVEIRRGAETFDLAYENVERNRQSWYLEYILTNENPAREVKALSLGSWILGRYQKIQQVFVAKETGLASKFLYRMSSLRMVTTAIVFCVYAYVVKSAMSGRITVGSMTLYIAMCQQTLATLGAAMSSVANLYESSLFMTNLFECFEMPEDDPSNHIEPGDTLEKAPSIEFQKVRFGYPNSERDVLKEFDLHIQPGEAMALVGLNGAGKTSIVKLLAGLYDPLEGKILIDGIESSTKRRGWLRQNVGVLFQDWIRFDFKTSENVGMGWVPSIDDQAEIVEAVRRAGADKLVSSLPTGLDSQLGTAFGGVDLSGGQWQNLVLARLLMRKSPILILDEPTSALDASAEAEMFSRFANWRKNRTIILVTHRFSTLKLVDRIAVLEKGRIVEIGTHDQLMQLGQRYSALFELQRSGYDFGEPPKTTEREASS